MAGEAGLGAVATVQTVVVEYCRIDRGFVWLSSNQPAPLIGLLDRDNQPTTEAADAVAGVTTVGGRAWGFFLNGLSRVQ